jgi:hypothetical protein
VFLLLGLLLIPGAASAEATPCGSVVKKIYSYTEGPPFFKAKVLVTSGEVNCSEARRVIWRALKPGGYWGGVNGWHCDPKGNADPYIEKCSQENPRRVIKSSKPKPCRSCRQNLKRVQYRELLRAGHYRRWKKCGETYLLPGVPPVAFYVKRVTCYQALVVFAHIIVDNLPCDPAACKVIGFTCVHPDREGSGLYCANDEHPYEKIRALANRH